MEHLMNTACPFVTIAQEQLNEEEQNPSFNNEKSCHSLTSWYFK
jgi:hypothetical protein